MKVIIRVITLCIAILGIGMINVQAQDAHEMVEAKVVDVIQKYMDKNAFMGVAAGISKKGTMTWSTRGYSNAKAQKVITAQTKMRTASIAKPMTAVAVMQLVEQKLIDLDAPIQTYIPNYPKDKAGEITTRQLLSHTAGIPAYANAKEAETQEHYPTLTAAVEVFKNRDLRFQPGTEFYYTTYGYVVLGLIIEKVSGMTYEQYMTQNIWEKAGMKNTGVEKYQSQDANQSSLYHRNKKGKIKLAKNENNLSNRVPGGGFYSTVEDLLQFGEAIINNELISAASLEEMLELGPVEKKGNPYGLGWFLYGEKGNQQGSFGHGGAQTGASSQIMIIPSRGTVVAVLSNTSGAWEDAVMLSVDLIEASKTGKKIVE